MLAGQNVAVDHLVKIIQDIYAEKMTGSLVVTRGKGISYELGTLVFLNGRVVQGRVGQHEGREALNWLLTWGKCWYTFVLSIVSDTDLRATAVRRSVGTERIQKAAEPKAGLGFSLFANRSRRQFSNNEARLHSKIPHVRLVPLGQTQRLHAVRVESATESWPSWSKGKQEQLTQKRSKVVLGEAGRLNETVPYISGPLEDGLRVLSEKGLSRIHRRVLLLINGSRRVEDLMRLLKLSEQEMLALLYGLQDAGVISLPSPLLL